MFVEPISSLDPGVASLWTDLALRWQQAIQAGAQWWWQSPAVVPPPRRVHPSTTGDASPFEPADIATLNAEFLPRLEALWNAARNAASRSNGPLPEIVAPAPGDRRFSSTAWRTQPYFSYVKQGYLLWGEYLHRLAAMARLDPADKRRFEFATRQFVDAFAPANFPATNPDVIARAMETEGASLFDGLQRLSDDVQKGRITMTDETAFSVGRNLAITPGSVVYRNELIELIQYDATTPVVGRTPLVIVPPCINKFYILDLRPENSFVRHVVGQGHTTFMLSWRNISQELAHLTWNDYLELGVLTALKVARSITGSKHANALGFCVGGTLLASALAVLATRGDHSVQSATFLTTMLDFADPGDIGVYITRESFTAREPSLLDGGRVHGSELASAFASLRANDLVWSYVVNNYLQGRVPPAFDLLYWNSDSANLAGPMYAYYLKNMYIDNRLRERGALTMAGAKIDLTRLTMPTYVYGSQEDHIVPWRSAYATTTLVGGDATFVLGASGHIAGVVNPPHPPRRHYWTNELLTEDADDWFARAERIHGSWWPHWYAWLGRHAGAQRSAPRAAGSRQHPPLDPAPGGYVTEIVN